jgi:hypothetical protein
VQFIQDDELKVRFVNEASVFRANEHEFEHHEVGEQNMWWV